MPALVLLSEAEALHFIISKFQVFLVLNGVQVSVDGFVILIPSQKATFKKCLSLI